MACHADWRADASGRRRRLGVRTRVFAPALVAGIDADTDWRADGLPTGADATSASALVASMACHADWRRAAPRSHQRYI